MANTVSENPRVQRGLRMQATFLIIFLVIQYILGMVTNLFVHFPDTTVMDQLWAFARTQGLIVAHIIVGTGLLIGSVAFVVRSVRSRSRRWITSAVIGLIAILAAFIGGVTFTSTQADGYSLLMALSAIAAFLSYGWGLVAAGR